MNRKLTSITNTEFKSKEQEEKSRENGAEVMANLTYMMNSYMVELGLKRITFVYDFFELEKFGRLKSED